jgi:hypothetical protein
MLKLVFTKYETFAAEPIWATLSGLGSLFVWITQGSALTRAPLG